MSTSRYFSAMGLALIVASVAGTTACSRVSAVEAANAASAEPAAVAVVKAVREDVARRLTLSAEFKPYQEIDVMSKVAGYVKSIYVDVGDQVRAGQPLAELEVPEMADDMTRADATIQRSTAEHSRAREELHRAESAHQMAHLAYGRLAAVTRSRPGLVAEQEVDEARGRDLVAEAQVSAAQGGLSAAEQQIHMSEAERDKTKTLFNYSRVQAPFAGVITRRFADTGSMIQAGTASQLQARPLVTLSQNNLLRLILPVPESAVPYIHVNQAVEVRVPTLGRSFPGRVARFAKSIQPATRTMETEIDVPNPNLVLVPGMFAEAALTLEEHARAIVIPVASITAQESNPWVLLVNDDNMLERREVNLGIEIGDRVEVLTGLKDGEMAVIGNRTQLKPGQRVAPKVVAMTALGGGQ